MAYMSQENKAAKAAALKKIIPKDWKWSLAVRHHMVLVMTIYAAPFDVLGFMQANTNYTIGEYTDLYLPQRETHLKGAPPEFLAMIDKIAGVLYEGNHDRSDPQTDYFDVGWYVDLTFGRYGKPFINTAEAPAAIAA